VVRHPMPYGKLAEQAVERFAHFEDLSLYKCTIEEREEYEPLICQGSVVYAGIDYKRILKAAEREGDVIIWDGGNNDFPFFRPDLTITLVDPLRPGDESSYFPGEVNLRRGDIVVINKINAAKEEKVLDLEERVRSINPVAQVVKTKSRITINGAAEITGKRVLVIEDGPTITHGRMTGGAGLAAAMEFHAGSIVDPRSYAFGSIAEIFRTYPHIGPVLPAMGYAPGQLRELRMCIESTPCDMILSATPINLNRIMTLTKPVKRVFYDIEEEEGSPLAEIVLQFLVRIRP
jgi:predicted GTPase